MLKNSRFLLISIFFGNIPMLIFQTLSSHKILEQFTFYDNNTKINNSFIDFINYKVYHIDKSSIIHKNQNNSNFLLKWKIEGQNDFSIQCVQENCEDINLSEHKVISFDFDRLLSSNWAGGVYAYILILYGFFSIKRGFKFINLSFIIYGTFGFVLFIREIIQLFELIGCLSSEFKKSEILVKIVFYSTFIISILYGFICHFSNYLKYATFGFIEGVMTCKLIFYIFLALKIIKNSALLYYFLMELFFLGISISLLSYINNKYPLFSIINISIISAIGIIFGINIINSGLPFIPYLILIVKYEEIDLYEAILDKKIIFYYAFLFIIFSFCGFYWNNSYNNFLNNKKSHLNKNII